MTLPSHLANMATREIEMDKEVELGTPIGRLQHSKQLSEKGGYELDERFPKSNIPRLIRQPESPLSDSPRSPPESPMNSPLQQSVSATIADFRRDLTTPVLRKRALLPEELEIVTPSIDTIASFLREGEEVLRDYISLPTNVFQLLSGSAESSLSLYIKVIYFVAQVTAFTPVMNDTTSLYERFKLSMVKGLQKNMHKVEAFTSKFDPDIFTLFTADQVKLAKGQVDRKKVKNNSPNVQRFLHTKDDIQSKRLRAWMTFFAAYNAAVSEYFDSLLQQYATLTQEYTRIMHKIVEISPEPTEEIRSIFRTAFLHTVDVDLINKVVRTPRRLLIREQTIGVDGPLLICKYLKHENICHGLHFEPGLLQDLKPIFQEFTARYAEFHNRIFQLGINMNLRFSSVMTSLNQTLNSSLQAFDSAQRRVNAGILKQVSSPEFKLYLRNLDAFYTAEAVQTMVNSQKIQIEIIESMLKQDFIFLHSWPISY